MHIVRGNNKTPNSLDVGEPFEGSSEPFFSLTPQKEKPWVKIVIVVAVIIVVLMGAYGAGMFYWSGRFWPGSSLDGVDLSGIAFAEARALFKDDPAETMLVVRDADTKTEDVVSAEDIGYGTDYDTPLETLKSEHEPLFWLPELLATKERSYTAQSSYDEKKLAELVPELSCVKTQSVKAQDARLEYSEGQFNIIKEIYGTEIESDILKKSVLDAVANEEDSIEVSDIDGIYIQPVVKSDNKSFADAKEKGEKMIAATQTWRVDDTTEVISSEDIASWLSLDASGQPVLDHDAVRSWWRSIGKKYDSNGGVKNFRTSGGSTINVSGGDWGGRSCDEASMCATSIEAIESGEPGSHDFVWSSGSGGGNGGLGGTYIEISISAQHLWYYRNGSLDYDYDCVTGKPDGRHDTPTGVYYIKDQATDYEMVGADEDGDGKEDYRTTCNFWSRITWSGIGIHDREHPSYGGSRYRSNGSHGCINSPYSAAQYIYNNVSSGTPVVIYS